MGEQEARWHVEFYTRRRGDSPIKQFVDGLPAEDQASVYEYLRYLRSSGTSLGPPRAKPITGHSPLWELRPGSIRLIYCLFTGRRFVILEALRKQGWKIPLRCIRTAQRRRKEILERIGQ